MSHILQTLDDLFVGETATICKIDDEEGALQLLELGFFEGNDVKLLHQGPFGKDPIAVEIRGAVIALHRSDAKKVIVSRRTLG